MDGHRSGTSLKDFGLRRPALKDVHEFTLGLTKEHATRDENGQ
jgi:hypothetical protein